MKLTGKQKTRLLAITGSALIAAAAGQFMERSSQKVVQPAPLTVAEGAAAVYDVDEVVALSAPAADPVPVEAAAPARALPDGPSITPLPETDTAALAVRVASLGTGAGMPGDTLARLSAPNVPCDPDFSAVPAGDGTVRLSLSLPCATAGPVTLAHEGLRFTLVRPADGQISVRLPALTPVARFTVTLDGGARFETEVQVPEAAAYEHVALQWQAGAGMQLHAFEFGADYGAPGHVWADAPKSAEAAMRSGGGYLTRLGDGDGPGALLAEIYSFPRALAEREGVVRINIEAEVSAANCGRDVTATALQPGADGRLHPAEVVLAMPGCDAVGEYLVLKNLLRDLKLAGN